MRKKATSRFKLIHVAIIFWLIGVGIEAIGAESVKRPDVLDEKQRIVYVSAILDAIQKIPGKKLEDAQTYVRRIAQGSCASQHPGLRVQCLMDTAERYCRLERSHMQPEDCRLLLDILVVNELNAGRFISNRERYEIMRSTKKYRQAIGDLVTQRQGVLAHDFHVDQSTKRKCASKQTAVNEVYQCLPKNLDQFCHGQAGSRNLSWQACIASLTWFIGRHHVPPAAEALSGKHEAEHSEDGLWIPAGIPVDAAPQ